MTGDNDRLDFQTRRKEKRPEDDPTQPKPTSSSFPLLLFISLSALAIVAVCVFFQIQLIALRRELATLKSNVSNNCEEERPRNLRKRSTTEHENLTREGAIATTGGTEAVHLHGTFPFQHIEKQGKIGPWSASTTDDNFVSLRKKNTEIEITHDGVYFIYAQVYYLTSEPHNSFQILSYNGSSEDRRHHRNIASCSSQGRNSMGDVSCFTGTVGSFRAGQRLYLNQVEQNRIVHFENGCSFFGAVLIKPNAVFKPIF